MTSEAKDTRLSDAQLVKVMDLIQGADSVELKLTVQSTEHRATIAALPVDPVEAEPRQIFFFDTPDLALNRAGVVVRARRVPGGNADTVIKLRPIVSTELAGELRKSPSFKVEVDCMPGGFVCSGSLKGKARSDEVREAAAHAMPLRKLFTKRQRAFYAEHAPAHVTLDSLATLGPIFALKMTFRPSEMDRKVVAELWLYPDGSRVLEVSTRCAPEDAFKVAIQLRAYVAKHGVTISSAQDTKTKTALEFYSRELQ
jgi:hypothetical protein